MIYDLLQNYQTHLQGKSVCWVLGTHDFKRVASRWRAASPDLQDDLVKQAMTLLLSLPGMVSIYQGEELGLPEAEIAFEDMQDPQGINYGSVDMTRDGCRVPIPWTDEGPSCGFSKSEGSLAPYPGSL